jgi:hypothetical protein
VLARHPGRVGFWGISQGTGVGLPLLAAGPRISAVVLGRADGPLASAPLVVASVLFYVQSDDDLIAPDACRALFATLGSHDKPSFRERWKPQSSSLAASELGEARTAAEPGLRPCLIAVGLPR